MCPERWTKGNSVGVNVSRYFTAFGASGNTIGGLMPGERNIISGNSAANVYVADPDTTNNSVVGNIIGPQVNGSSVGMTNGDGIQVVANTDANIIGPRNVISTNVDGIEISGFGTGLNVVKGNFIGTSLDGTIGVPNATGVRIEQAALDNDIGTATPGDGNIIAFNTGTGIYMAGTATGNSIRGNSIHSNGGAEIDNIFLNLGSPVITSTMNGSVSGFACAGCAVDIFSDPSTDAKYYEGSVSAAADGSFTFVNNAPFIEGRVTATNTDASGNTSELAVTVIVDSDADGTVDEFDSDDDNDGMLDSNDSCRVFPEDYDGFEDANGCPESDNDTDGICDSGQSSVSCTGSDFGKTAFYPSIPNAHPHGDPPAIDCRNTPEDFDAFEDSDGCPEPDNDNDGFPDATDDCPGTGDIAGADGVLGSSEDDNHNGRLDPGGANVGEDNAASGGDGNGVLTTDDTVLTFEDYDTILDSDGCHDSPGDDRDGDGFTDEAEVLRIGTRADDSCGGDGWPAELSGNDNRLNIGDFNSFIFPPRADGSFNKFGHPVPDPNDSSIARWNLESLGVGAITINIADLNALNPAITAPTARPPMFGGQPAFFTNGGLCPLPP